MNRTRGFLGFTLLELLVAASLAVLTMGAAGIFFGRALSAWQKTQGRLESLFTVERRLERLGVELRNGVLPNGASFSGASDSIAFVSGQEMGPLRQIRYLLLPQGQSQALVREEEPFPPGEGTLQRTVLIPRVRSFSVQYSYQGKEGAQEVAWKSNWQLSHQLPRLLKVNLEIEDKQEARGGSYSVIREFWIPQGTVAPLLEE